MYVCFFLNMHVLHDQEEKEGLEIDAADRG
jgi:hypothetical protein